MLEEVKKSLESSPIVKKGEYNYFVNPISDGVPAMNPLMLRELALAVHKYADLDVDKIVAVEAMGIHLATALSLATDIPFVIIRKRQYGLEGETEVYQKTGYGSSNLFINDLHAGEKILLIDDVVSTGGTLIALLKTLKEALNNGAKIRILTGNYLGITQPSALYMIKRELHEQVDLRFYNEKDRSFHPKSYIFHYSDYSDIYIGSSNISRSALTSGIEWNYRFSSKTDPDNYNKFFQTFEDLFKNHSIKIDDKTLKEYSKGWHKPAAAKDLEKYDNSEQNNNYKIVPIFEPRGAQIEALCALENTRAEGAKKALVTAATGIGKTALAAFDSLPYKRILFVAHREEILKQAALTFKNIRNTDDYGFFNGSSKEINKPII